MRYPRVFQSECKVMKEYCEIDSRLYAIIRKIENEGLYEHPIFIESFPTIRNTCYLVILQTDVLLIDVPHNKITDSAPINTL
jgi:hypothetical protein